MNEELINKKIASLCEALSNIKNDWAITGGSNHFLRYIVDNINDIDIITTKNGGKEISDALSKYQIQPYQYMRSQKIKSYFSVFNYKGIKIEVMAEPINLINNSWTKNNKWKNNIEKYGFNKCRLPLTNIEYEFYIYNLLRNNKRRIKLLQNYIHKQKINSNKHIDDGRGDSPRLRTIDSLPRPSC